MITWIVPSGIAGMLYMVWKLAGVLLFSMTTVKHILFWVLVLFPFILKAKCKKDNGFLGIFG